MYICCAHDIMFGASLAPNWAEIPRSMKHNLVVFALLFSAQ